MKQAVVATFSSKKTTYLLYLHDIDNSLVFREPKHKTIRNYYYYYIIINTFNVGLYLVQSYRLRLSNTHHPLYLKAHHTIL
jgi:hypothetical protein